jgi:hypothetical protein
MLAEGATVTGATPMPAETSATARLRCLSIQALASGHHRRIKAAGGNADQHAEAKLELPQLLRLARASRAEPSSTLPASTTMRVP